MKTMVVFRTQNIFGKHLKDDAFDFISFLVEMHILYIYFIL